MIYLLNMEGFNSIKSTLGVKGEADTISFN